MRVPPRYGGARRAPPGTGGGGDVTLCLLAEDAEQQRSLLTRPGACERPMGAFV